MSTLLRVDANVWLDMSTDDPVWGDSSSRDLARARNRDEVAINPLI
jgi:hypothetical protein